MSTSDRSRRAAPVLGAIALSLASYGVIVWSGSSANTIVSCTAIGNWRYDAYGDGTGSANAWYRNTFGTKTGL